MSTEEDREVAAEVLRERDGQDALWGEQNHPDGLTRLLLREHVKSFGVRIEDAGRYLLHKETCWSGIFMEEVGEALRADSLEHLREELIQVAAVAQAWVAAIDRRALALRAPQDGPRAPGPEGEATMNPYRLTLAAIFEIEATLHEAQSYLEEAESLMGSSDPTEELVAVRRAVQKLLSIGTRPRDLGQAILQGIDRARGV